MARSRSRGRSSGKRTKKGNVTARARRRHGVGKGKRKKFPIFDTKSARSALRLRGHTKTKAARRSVINRAARYIPSAASAARRSDRKAGKI